MVDTPLPDGRGQVISAYCHIVDAIGWAAVGSVAGCLAVVATIAVAVIQSRQAKRSRATADAGLPLPLRVEPSEPPASGQPQRTNAVPVVVGDIPQEPAGYQARKDLLAELDQPMRASHAPTVVAVTGMLGVGKTHLVAAYARARMEEKWRLVGWVNAADDAAVLLGLSKVASALRLEVAGSAAKAGEEVRRWLEADGDRCLLVFDSVSDLDTLRPFLPAGGGARVLLTSNLTAAESLATTVPVDVFTPEQAVTFLAKRTEQADSAGASMLAAELGYLPLALAQAAPAVMKKAGGYETYLKRLRETKLDKYLARVAGDTYPRSLAAAVLLALDAARESDNTDVCGALMEAVSVLSPGGAPRTLLHAAGKFGLRVRNGRSAPIPAAMVDEALAHLAGSSLLTFSVDGGSAAAHPLVMRVVREQLAEKSLAEVCDAVGEVLIEQAALVRGEWEQARVRGLVEQMTALCEHAPRDAGPTLTRRVLGLRLEVARFRDDLGDNAARAVPDGEQLLRDAERDLGPNDSCTLYSRHNLAIAYQQAGRHSDAVKLHEKNLAERKRVLRPDDPDILTSRDNLAAAYQDAGRAEEAISLHEKTFADRKRLLGPDAPDTRASRNNLAIAYQASGRVDRAIALHRENLPDERIPETSAADSNRRTVNRLADAVIYERTLADGQRTIGTEHPEALRFRNNLWTGYLEAGHVAEAVASLDRIFHEKKSSLGNSHPSTLASASNLAVAHLMAGNVHKAAAILEETAVGCDRLLGDDHKTTKVVHRNLDFAKASARSSWRSMFYRRSR